VLNQARKYGLLPLTLIYCCVLRIRHWLYNIGVFKTWKPPIKTICIGNLSFGGTGKTPFTLYLIRALKKDFKIAVVSRGYGRKTKGLVNVQSNAKSHNVGDEPLQIKNQFPEILVVVCEKRKTAIEWIAAKHPSINLILLDDAFQHRAVKADVNLLLTTYQNPFFNDALFPSGNLRDIKVRAKDVDAIIVTKCPKDFEPLSINQPIYYSTIQYQNWQKLQGDFSENQIETVLLVTGIAQPKYLLEHFENKKIQLLQFPDHHNYSLNDLERINTAYQKINASNKCIITTEKDWMRLQAFNDKIAKFDWQLAYLPITIKVDDEEGFLNQILQKIKQ